MPNRYLYTCIVALLTPTLPAMAKDAPHVVLDEMVITATRTPTKVGNVIAQTTVITASDLARHQGQSVLDVLKSQAGISHYTNGGTGKASNFYLRGFDGKSILVLIDGVRYASLSTGSPALSLLPSEQIERIEIVHGASGSSIYGADAVGGVIQIFTKKANKDGIHASATLGVGSHKHINAGAIGSLKNESSHLTISAGHNKTDGINAITEPAALSQSDKDGFKSSSVSLSAGHKINEQLDVGASVLYAKSTSDYDNIYTSQSDLYAKQKNGASQVFATWHYQDNNWLKLHYGQSWDKSDNFAGGTNTGHFDSKQQQWGLTASHALPVGTLIGGLERQQQNLGSTNTYRQNKRDTNSVFAGYQTSTNQLDGQVFVRYDDSSQYGKNTTYNAGIAYHIMPNLRAGASYAKGFRAPSFNEAYNPSSGNPNLNPEKSHNYELFGEYKDNQQKTRLTLYRNRVNDLIAWFMTDPTTFAGKNRNINKAKTQGATLTSDWYLDNYLLGFSYDYQRAVDDSHGFSHGKSLAIRPKHKGLVYAGYGQGNFDVRGEYQYVGKYYYDTSEEHPVDSYGLVNVVGNYQLTPNVRLTGRINNLLDKKYSTAKGYGTTYGEDGRNFFGSVTVSY